MRDLAGGALSSNAGLARDSCAIAEVTRSWPEHRAAGLLQRARHPATAGKFGEKEKGDIPQAELLGITRDELIRRRQTFNQAVELGACEEKIPADALLEKYVTDPRAMREYGRCITQLEVRHGLLAR